MAREFIGGPGRRIALVVHPERTRAHELAKIARAWWEQHDFEVIEDASVGGPDPTLLDKGVDLVVSLGGDGTMLRTVQLAAPHGIPVMGVNLGALGYLTQVEPNSIENAFERLVKGDYQIEERMTLDVLLNQPGATTSYVALNDAVVEKTSLGHTIRLQLSIGGEPFLTYVADGFLVATPSGSTAYNLSLRGPIASPRLAALILTPIAPHQLFDRSMILEPTESVRLDLIGERPGVLIVDGLTNVGVDPGDSITVRADGRPARVVSFGGENFYGVLRSKFGLADR